MLALQEQISLCCAAIEMASGSKPFLYDVSVELCDYLEKRNHPFLNIIFNAASSNNSWGSNHCPLSEVDILNLPFPVKMLAAMPLPTGEYAIYGTLSADAIERANVQVYFMLADF